eukprot:s1_g1471.t1
MILGSYLVETRGRVNFRSWSWAIVLVLLSFAALTILWAPDQQIAADRFAKLAVFLPSVTALTLVSAQSADIGGHGLRKMLLAAQGLGLFFLIWAVVTFGGLFVLLNPDLPYLDAPSGNNRATVLLVLLVTTGLLAARHLSIEPWYWVAVAVLGGFLFFSSSQTALLAFLVWAVIFGLSTLSQSTVKHLLFWGGGVFILTQPFLVLAIEWMDPDRSLDLEIASVGARLDVWIAVAHKAMEAPIFGHGLEATRSIKDWANEFYYFSGRDIPHPHNGILQIWIELGLFGASLAALVWVAAIRSLERFSVEDRPALHALAAAFLVVISISHGFWQSWWIWGAFGVIAITLTQARRQIGTVD